MGDTTFFYPNCCHVCKGWEKKLISCPKCQMIFYCSKRHRQEHSSQHEEICATIKSVLGDNEYMNTEEISTTAWWDIRNEYRKKVSGILKRDLKKEEVEMILFPKACAVCYRQDAVIRCKHCPSTAFCDKHKDNSEHREMYCEWLKECLEVDNYLTMAEDIDTSYVNRLSDETSFRSMVDFASTCFPLETSNKYLRMIQSNRVTFPLTVYFCIKRLDYVKCKTLSIHIIGRRIISSPADIELWKMLLILIPTLRTLTITLIQKEKPLSELDIPTEVVWKTKKLVTNVRYMSYAEYMRTTEFKKPNFIVGFDAIVIDDTCPTDEYVNISALVGKMCPCILVFDYISSEDIKMLKQINNYFFGKNPFLNLMLHRYFPSQSVYYRYIFLIIFNNLDSSKVFIKGNRSVLFPKITGE